MNLVLLYPDEAIGAGRFRVRGARHQHVRDVLGLSKGERVRAGILEGAAGTANVASLSDEELVLEDFVEESVPARAKLDLFLALPRPKTLKRLLPQIAALGVDRLVLFRCWRVERAYLDSPILTPELYEPLLDEGLMQARDTRRPRVSLEPRFVPFVEDRLGSLAGERRIVFHPAGAAFRTEAIDPSIRVSLVVGPEGGFLPKEVAKLEALGFEVAGLGPRILRTDTATVMALGLIAAARGFAD
ncbi:MAG: 16S rRNA (uracil(1498)-N(3))-methyltransferase [Deltaproteobacteria bacterium]|nr:16S rRNA (uracil(1498)-N(3))-methyltransferase [Deltaproteobacteria bacterium]